MSSLAASVLALRAGLEPVMQLTCRDRKPDGPAVGPAGRGRPRGAQRAALTGDHPTLGDHHEARPVFDLDGVQLTWAARTLRDEGTNWPVTHWSGGRDWLIGTVENPFAPPTGLRGPQAGQEGRRRAPCSSRPSKSSMSPGSRRWWPTCAS